MVNPLFPQLSAPPYGFTKCECCGTGLVVIKHPFLCKEGVCDDELGRSGSFMNQQGLVKGHKYYLHSSLRTAVNMLFRVL